MIILTGSSGGIGSCILEDLSKLDEVIALYHANPPTFSVNTRIYPYKINLALASEIEKFSDFMAGRLKKVTLIHAAALSRDGLVINFDVDDWDCVIDINLRSNFLLNKAILKFMLKENWGRIIHFSSVVGTRASRGTVAYATSKTGLVGMSRALATEYARFGVTSNIILNGYFNTGMYHSLSPELKKKAIDSIPSGKLGDVSNIVNAIKFLMDSDYVNGASINIDGGI